jgi:hypothetical protein
MSRPLSKKVQKTWYCPCNQGECYEKYKTEENFMHKLLSGSGLLLSLLFLVSCESEQKIESCEYNGAKVDCSVLHPKKAEEPKPKKALHEVIYLKVEYSKIGNDVSIKPNLDYFNEIKLVDSNQNESTCTLDLRKGLEFKIIGNKDGIDISSAQNPTENIMRSAGTPFDRLNYMLGEFDMFDTINNRLFQKIIINNNDIEFILHCYLN